jgi:hypothetical protein
MDSLDIPNDVSTGGQTLLLDTTLVGEVGGPKLASLLGREPVDDLVEVGARQSNQERRGDPLSMVVKQRAVPHAGLGYLCLEFVGIHDGPGRCNIPQGDRVVRSQITFRVSVIGDERIRYFKDIVRGVESIGVFQL